MAHRVVHLWFPARGAPPRAFRLAGGLYLTTALTVGVLLTAAFVAYGRTHLLPMALLPVLAAWLTGTHLVLWGGFSAAGSCGNWGRVALTALAGYASLAAVSVLVGAVAAALRSAV